MRVYIWQRVKSCSNSWHSEGGVVVFAETEERARELSRGMDGCEIGDDEKPDEVRECFGAEKVFIFPDAGCC